MLTQIGSLPDREGKRHFHTPSRERQSIVHLGQDCKHISLAVHVQSIELVEESRGQFAATAHRSIRWSTRQPLRRSSIKWRVEGKAPSLDPNWFQPYALQLLSQFIAGVVAQVADPAFGGAHLPLHRRDNHISLTHKSYVAKEGHVIGYMFDNLETHHQIKLRVKFLKLNIHAIEIGIGNRYACLFERFVGNIDAGETISVRG